MEAIQVEDNENQFFISIDKNAIDKETLLELLTKIRVEHLSRKADFSEDIEQLGEEIKSDCWRKDKDKWLSRGK
ncbi:hypothetical protein BH24BAC1_BH24BAC1_33270 [soil metagenome]